MSLTETPASGGKKEFAYRSAQSVPAAVGVLPFRWLFSLEVVSDAPPEVDSCFCEQHKELSP